MLIIPLTGHSGKGKTMRTENRLVVAGGEGWRKGLTKKEMYEGQFWGKRTVLYRNCGVGYTALCMYQNSQNCTPKAVNFN